jgi:hypothetical protein
MVRYQYDYYRVAVPGDMFDGDDAVRRLGEVAIDEARERATLYVMPASWTATRVAGDVGDLEVVFRVVRKRLARRSTAGTGTVRGGLP